MRVAACISGQLRTLEYCFPSMVKHLFEPTDADVFIYAKNCTLEEVQRISKPWPTVTIEIGEDINQETLYSREILAACDSKGSSNRFDIRNFLAQTQSVKACNAMRNRQGVKYDLVIRLRTDMEFFSSMKNPSEYDPSLLYVPNFDTYDGINDKLAVSGPDVMDIYAKWGDEVVDNILQNKVCFQAEKTLKTHMDNHGVVTADLDIQFSTYTLFVKRRGKLRKLPYSAKHKPKTDW